MHVACKNKLTVVGLLLSLVSAQTFIFTCNHFGSPLLHCPGTFTNTVLSTIGNKATADPKMLP